MHVASVAFFSQVYVLGCWIWRSKQLYIPEFASRIYQAGNSSGTSSEEGTVASGWSSGESFTYCTVLDPSSKLLYIFAIYDKYIAAVEPRFAHERLDNFYISNNNILQDYSIDFSRRLNCCLSRARRDIPVLNISKSSFFLFPFTLHVLSPILLIFILI